MKAVVNLLMASRTARVRRTAVLIVVLATFTACGPIVPPDRMVAEGSGIEGFVRDQNGAPMEVNVSVLDANGTSVISAERTWSSDAEGRYHVSAPPGTWLATYSRPGYAYVKVPVTIRDRVYARVDVLVVPSR